jgi:hypothetical protein
MYIPEQSSDVHIVQDCNLRKRSQNLPLLITSERNISRNVTEFPALTNVLWHSILTLVYSLIKTALR